VSNLAVTIVDRLFIVVCGVGGPTDAEWAAYLDLVRRNGVDRTMQIVATEGGGPTSAQRHKLEELLAGRVVPVVIISNSIRVRWRVAIMSCLGRQTRAFRPSDLREALSFLEIPVSRAGLIEREVCRLRQAVTPDGARKTGA
jgi:hypothetical protein